MGADGCWGHEVLCLNYLFGLNKGHRFGHVETDNHFCSDLAVTTIYYHEDLRWIKFYPQGLRWIHHFFVGEQSRGRGTAHFWKLRNPWEFISCDTQRNVDPFLYISGRFCSGEPCERRSCGAALRLRWRVSMMELSSAESRFVTWERLQWPYGTILLFAALEPKAWYLFDSS